MMPFGYSNPTPEELEAASRPAFLTPKSGIGRKQSMTSGQVNDAVLAGVAQTPYNLLGAPVDLTTLAMMPFGYSNPTPVMGSEWLKAQATRAGIRPATPTQPTARALYEMGQFGAGAVNPAAPVRAAANAVSRTGQAARDVSPARPVAPPVVEGSRDWIMDQFEGQRLLQLARQTENTAPVAAPAAAPAPAPASVVKVPPAPGSAAQMLDTVKKSAPSEKTSSIFSHNPTNQAPFVGRLDEFVATLPGPVQKDQFLGQVRSKFRDYDIARAEELLADLPGNAKLTPVELLNLLKTKYDPSSWKTTVVPPDQPGIHYQSIDNIYEDPLDEKQGILGVIHLSHHVGPSDLAKQPLLLGLANSLFKIQDASITDPNDTLVKITNALNNKSLGIPEELASKIQSVAEKYKKATSPINDIQKIETKLLVPQVDPELMQYEEQVRARLAAQNPDLGAIALGRMSRAEVARKGFEEANQLLVKYGEAPLPVPNFDRLGSLSPASAFPELVEEIVGSIKSLKSTVRGNVRELRNEIINVNQAVNKKYPYEALTMGDIGYKGQHPELSVPGSAMGLTKQDSPVLQPIAFSRFSEHTTEIPGMGKVDGIYVNELQSDRLDDLRKSGKTGGSLEQDQKAVDALEEKQIAVSDKLLRAEIAPTRDEKLIKQLKTEREILRSKMFALENRISAMKFRPGYVLSESFAGMENSPQVIQQLMIKNAVIGAMQAGPVGHNRFVAFPGAESAQPQLYEKLMPNLKSAVKDLGPGFEVRSVTLRDSTGKERMHNAIVWGPEAAARTKFNGVPFKDGGLVERRTDERRKYL